MLQTANSNITGLSPRVLRDGDASTCIAVPSYNSRHQYLKARMSWPIHSVSDPNYNVSVVVNLDVECDNDYMIVYMKVGATWGDPNFKGPMTMCSYMDQSADTTHRTCAFSCTPAPQFSEGLYVYIRNVRVSTAELCEVIYSH